MTTAYPPTIHHTTTPLSSTQALSLLTSYLTAATADPSLHPHAHLTEHGPVAPSNAGLVLHNLRRVEAGLRGENLGEDLTVRKNGGENGVSSGSTMMPDDDGVVLDKEGPNASEYVNGEDTALLQEKQGAVETMEGDWQDKSEFERQQEIVQGDVGKRDNAVERGVEEDGGGYVPQVKATWAPKDKDARRGAKKERRKKLQMELQAQKQKDKRDKVAEQG